MVELITGLRAGEVRANLERVRSEIAAAGRDPREVQILDNIAQGMTNKEVAYALAISEQTVKNHMSSILRKLSVNDRTQAVVYAIRQGWIKGPEMGN